VAKARLRAALETLMADDGSGDAVAAQKELDKWDAYIRAHPDYEARRRTRLTRRSPSMGLSGSGEGRHTWEEGGGGRGDAPRNTTSRLASTNRETKGLPRRGAARRSDRTEWPRTRDGRAIDASPRRAIAASPRTRPNEPPPPPPPD
jgi:hypothetical protein